MYKYKTDKLGPNWLQMITKSKPDLRIKGRVIFIDEASMVDTPLLNIILEFCKDCKIVFIGDKEQLAPVGEELSPVFSVVEPQDRVFLNEQMRNAGQPHLMALCKQLRATVQTGEFYPIEEVPGVIDYLDDEQMGDYLERTFAHPGANSRILCYTNNRVADYAEFLRDVRGLPQQFTAGEHAVVAKAYAMGKTNFSVEREVGIISVGDEIYKGGYAHATPNRDEILYHEAEVAYINEDGSIPRRGAVVKIPLDMSYVRRTLRNLASAKNWSEYHPLNNSMMDIRMPEACTVHKSQGSTYDSVFIDLGNIGTCRDKDMVARMLFVAFSRAKSRVYLYGTLPGKYHRSESNDQLVTSH